MTKATHTPAPWEVKKDSDGDKYIAAPRSDNMQIIICDKVWDEANVRLIAAAPELLEALQRVMEQIADTGTCNQIEGAKALAVIAKAKGL